MINKPISNVIVIDTETTGKNPYSDEILQVSIISGSGRVLFNEFIKPLHTKSWPEAQKVNHISPQKVSRCKTFKKYLSKIQTIIDSADFIVGYNLKHFDIPFLENSGIIFRNQEIVDVFLDVKGYFKKWPKLVDVALCAGYVFTPHDALEDCKATLHIFNKCYKIVVEDKAKAEGFNSEETKNKVAEAKKTIRSGRLFELLFTIIILVSGIFLFYKVCLLGQRIIPVKYGELRGIYFGLSLSGLYCYVSKGIIGPVIGTIGLALFSYKYCGIMLTSIPMLTTLLSLKLFFWLTKRQKNLPLRFLACSIAIFISILLFYHLLGQYIVSIQTVISLQDYSLNNSLRNAIVLELSLPFYMLLSNLFEIVF